MAELMIDFSHGTLNEKRDFLKAHPHHAVVMDLSCIDPQVLYAEFPQLKGSFPGQLAMRGKVELHLKEEVLGVEAALLDRGLTAVRTSYCGLGFTVPRILSLIVNEAFFALEEAVASQQDIDRAMRFGVNYPGGPFEWAKGRESMFLELLKALQKKTGDARYEPAKQLVAAAGTRISP